MVDIKAWFASVDQPNEADKKAPATQQTKSQRRFGKMKVCTLDGGCTVLIPPIHIWANKQKRELFQD